MKSAIFLVVFLLAIPLIGCKIANNLLNDQVGNFAKNMSKNRTKLDNKPQNRADKLTNMRKSSDQALYVSQIAQYAFDLVMGKTNSKAKRQTTSTILSLNSSFCPFVNVSCDTSAKYRSYDGTCNNLKNPLYGSANTPYKRLLTPAYQDNFNSPRTLAVSGSALPNPRIISKTIFDVIIGNTTTEVLENNWNMLFPSFGQFLAHDIVGTAATVDSSGSEIACPCNSTDPSCSLAIPVPTNDKVLNFSCMQFTRSAPTFPFLNCSLNYREQTNLLSSYIDGTQVYGMNQDISKLLRSFTGGQLKTSQGIFPSPAIKNSNTLAMVGITNRTYLPLSSDSCSPTNTTPTFQCFLAGEYRTSENLNLAGMQTLFMREHNRIASQLASLNPTWSDEILYQQARRIIIAYMQHITYNEWLPQVTGTSNGLKPLTTSAYYTGYNSSINSAISNEFATNGFRFGHSLIRNNYNAYPVNKTTPSRGVLPSIRFEDMTFKTAAAYSYNFGGLNSFMNSMLLDGAWKYGTFGSQLQNSLFKTFSTYYNQNVSTDLFAFNIQRGRDHGLPSYAQYLKYCTGTVLTSFTDLKDKLLPARFKIFSTLYQNVNDIDLYVGGLSEARPVDAKDGLVGPTFKCIINKQFADLKNSDRFYYENGPSVSPNAFTLQQLAEIKKITFSRLVCNNFDIFNIQRDAFNIPNATINPLTLCSTIAQPDLSLWKGISV